MDKFKILLKKETWSSGITFKSSHQHSAGVNCIAIEPSEQRYLASGGLDGYIALYDTTTSRFTNFSSEILPLYVSSQYSGNRQSSTNSITGISWCPYDPRILSTCTTSGTLCIWDVSMMLKNDYDPLVFTFDIGSGVLCQRFMEGSGFHGLIAVGVSTTEAISPLIRICDLRSGTQRQNLYSNWLAHESQRVHSVHCIVESVEPHRLVFGCSDGTIRSWDTRKQLTQYSNPTTTLLKCDSEIISLSMADDKSKCYYYTSDGTLGNISLLSHLERNVINNSILKLRFRQFMPHGALCSLFETCAAASDLDAIAIIDMDNAVFNDTVILRLEQHWDQVTCLQWASQSMAIYSCGKDNRILKWQAGK